MIPDSLVADNPNYYNSYVAAGDYYFKKKAYEKALPYYRKALSMEIATVAEKDHIVHRIEKCKNK
ncbi:hypothetical protein LWM68_42140 [Niabella sp. W65]|nr:hypothetical protein [Niabella sp. W65]MCH7368752.1 hypothetical protein [Niabella sp. W65]ULT44326.1 hypothetical protein KRR40_13830 [Niabella sp. I65]